MYNDADLTIFNVVSYFSHIQTKPAFIDQKGNILPNRN